MVVLAEWTYTYCTVSGSRLEYLIFSHLAAERGSSVSTMTPTHVPSRTAEKGDSVSMLLGPGCGNIKQIL